MNEKRCANLHSSYSRPPPTFSHRWLLPANMVSSREILKKKRRRKRKREGGEGGKRNRMKKREAKKENRYNRKRCWRELRGLKKVDRKRYLRNVEKSFETRQRDIEAAIFIRFSVLHRREIYFSFYDQPSTFSSFSHLRPHVHPPQLPSSSSFSILLFFFRHICVHKYNAGVV